MWEMKVVVLLLWLGSGPVLSSVWREFFHRSGPRTWENARQYCRSKYAGDLATLVTSSEVQEMNLKIFEAWIGLKMVNSEWQWVDENFTPSRKRRSSEETENTVYQVFAKDEPNDGEGCGRVTYSRAKAYGESCNAKRFVLCEAESNNFLPVSKTWDEGLQYCRAQGFEYLTFPDTDDLSFDGSPVYEERDFPVWIGLHDHSGVWGWSDGTYSNYRAWDSGSDPGSSPGSCVAVSSQSHKMTVKSCDETFPFVCYRHTLVLVPELLTWEQGLEHCRGLSSSHRMLSVEEDEVVYVKSLTTEATTSKLWVGLRFLNGFWFWSDGSPVTLPTLPLCPEQTLHCGAMDLNSTSIIPFDCSQKLNVLCYSEIEP